MKAPNGTKLLFVDDEEGVRASWSRYFSEKGFDVATAPNGQHALNSLAERPADVVVSDYRMPGADGLQLLEQVHEKHPETPFILLTGYGTEDLANEALRKGAFAYLRKPIDPETLTGMLTSALDFRVSRGAAEVRRAEMPAVQLAATPAIAVATATAQAKVATPAVQSAVTTKARVIGGLKVAGSMIAAPIVGLAFVIFFPIIGFAAFFKVLGETIWGLFKKAEVQPRVQV